MSLILSVSIPAIIFGGISIAYLAFESVIWFLFYRYNQSYKDFLKEI